MKWSAMPLLLLPIWFPFGTYLISILEKLRNSTDDEYK